MSSTIIFVNQPVSIETTRDSLWNVVNNTAPLTLCLLASITRKHGYSTVILDAASHHLSMEETVARIIRKPPTYLALYTTTLTLEAAGQIALAVKKACPEVVVIVGGVHLTYCPEQTMESYPAFDIGVISEGDRTIIELLNALDNGGDLAQVEGIIFRSTTHLLRTAVREPLDELDALPMPAFDLLEDFPDNYLPPPLLGFSSLPTATLVVSRGCPGRCLFCSSGIFGHTQPRVHSAKYIVELMRHLERNYGVRQIQFYDDDLCAFRKQLTELCETLIGSGVRVTWSCNSRVTDVTPELLARMRRAGCWKIAYGIESGSQRHLNRMRKGITLKGIRRAVQWTRQAGILAYGYFFFGYPGETEKEMQETIDFALSLDLDMFECNAFIPHPTLLFPQGFDLRNLPSSGPTVPCNGGVQFNSVPSSGDCSAETIDAHVRQAWRRFYFRPLVQLNLLRLGLKNRAMLSHYLQAVGEFVRFLLFPPKDVPSQEEE